MVGKWLSCCWKLSWFVFAWENEEVVYIIFESGYDSYTVIFDPKILVFPDCEIKENLCGVGIIELK